MGSIRNAFYRVKKAYDEGGIEAIKEKSHRKPNIRNWVANGVEQDVVELASPKFLWGNEIATNSDFSYHNFYEFINFHSIVLLIKIFYFWSNGRTRLFRWKKFTRN